MLVKPSGHAEMPVLTEGMNCTAYCVLRGVGIRVATVSEKLIQVEDTKKASIILFSENVSVAALLSEARAETPKGREVQPWIFEGEGWENT